MTFDASALRHTSVADHVPWRAPDVTFLLISAAGRIRQAKTITEKRAMLDSAGPEDCLLLAWPGRYSQDVFWIDDRDRAASGLEPPPRH